jgi:hypothetical protein
MERGQGYSLKRPPLLTNSLRPTRPRSDPPPRPGRFTYSRRGRGDPSYRRPEEIDQAGVTWIHSARRCTRTPSTDALCASAGSLGTSLAAALPTPPMRGRSLNHRAYHRLAAGARERPDRLSAVLMCGDPAYYRAYKERCASSLTAFLMTSCRAVGPRGSNPRIKADWTKRCALLCERRLRVTQPSTILAAPC